MARHSAGVWKAGDWRLATGELSSEASQESGPQSGLDPEIQHSSHCSHPAQVCSDVKSVVIGLEFQVCSNVKSLVIGPEFQVCSDVRFIVVGLKFQVCSHVLAIQF